MGIKVVDEIIRLQQKHYPCDMQLLKRLIKCCVHTTVCFILCLIPNLRHRLGLEPAFLPLISVIIHPGRRLSATIQHTFNCGFGLLSGVCWALFSREIAHLILGKEWNILSELEQKSRHFVRYQSALAVLCALECIMLFYHGWMRSVDHRNFAVVFPTFLVVHFSFSEQLTKSAKEIGLGYTAPFFFGIAMALVWNIILFPEFGSTYLGTSVIETLNTVHSAIDDSIQFFTASANNDASTKNLKDLVDYKLAVQKRISNSDLVFTESAFEVSYSYLSPHSAKPVIDKFRDIALNINGLINACQLEFYSLNNDKSADFIKTEREIQFLNKERLLDTLKKLEPSITDLGSNISTSLFHVKKALVHSYDVPSNKMDVPAKFQGETGGLESFESIAHLIESLKSALQVFEESFNFELSTLNLDMLTPSDEMFVLSSFLMNLKECTNTVISIMKDTEEIVSKRKEREAKGAFKGKRVWFNFMGSFKKFFQFLVGPSQNATGALTESQCLQGNVGEKQIGSVNANFDGGAAQRPKYEEQELLGHNDNLLQIYKVQTTATANLPISIADKNLNTKELSFTEKVNHFAKWFLIKCKTSWRPHMRFGFQVTVCLTIVSVPMFLPEGREWYGHVHGPWIAFVAVLCMEPNVGGTFWVTFLRSVGVLAGSAWAYLAWAAGHCGHNDPYLETFVALIGAFPGFYYFIATPYVKGAIIYIITIYIVILASIIPSTSLESNILQNFAKRCLAVAAGAPVALLTQLLVFPVKARDCLNEELSFVCGCLSQMILLIEGGLDGDVAAVEITPAKLARFRDLSSAAKNALSRAAEYKGLTKQEPRIKGQFIDILQTQTDVINIMREIVERCDTVASLRHTYGTAILEDYHTDVYAYRRQYVASLLATVRCLEEAFVNKTPLPASLPSARICHRRFINHIRSVTDLKYGSNIYTSAQLNEINSESDEEGVVMLSEESKTTQLHESKQKILKDKLLCWNAINAGVEEVIEFSEELVTLTKRLVGVTDFQYGFLSRPLDAPWAVDAVVDYDTVLKPADTDSKRSDSKGSTDSTDESDDDNGLGLAKLPTMNRTITLDPETRARKFSIGSINIEAVDAIAHVSGHPHKVAVQFSKDQTASFNDDQEKTIGTNEELPQVLKNLFN